MEITKERSSPEIQFKEIFVQDRLAKYIGAIFVKK